MAQKHGAEVVGVFVSRELQSPIFNFSEIRPKNYPTAEEYAEMVMAAGQIIMKPLKDAAEAAGVKFTGIVKISNATVAPSWKRRKKTTAT